MNIAAAISQASVRLESSGVDEPRREAATLAAFAVGRDRTFVFAHPEYELAADEAARFADAVERRAAREPFHYITGEKEFYGLNFRVGPGVLIPRPETELLVERAISILSPLPRARFLEIGAGSGCISIAILKNAPNSSAVATEISQDALSVALENTESHAVATRLDLRFGNTYAGIDEKFDLIASNPPYIPESDRAYLEKDVVGFEPEEALFGGGDGLSVVRKIVAGANERLVPGGSILIEIGIGQSPQVHQMLEAAGLSDVHFIRDLQAIDRIAVAKK